MLYKHKKGEIVLAFNQETNGYCPGKVICFDGEYASYIIEFELDKKKFVHLSQVFDIKENNTPSE